METKTQSKFKSKIFWLGILSIVMLILTNYGLWDAIGMTSETFKTLANLVFAVLSALGVFNDPSNAEKL